MSFPVINGSNGGNIVVNATSSTINNPASIAAGERLFALVTVDQNTGSAFTGWPTGWIESFAVDNSTNHRMECRYKDADGSEGASFTLTHLLNMSCHTTWKYQAGTFDAATPPAVAISTGIDTTPTPPALDPAAWGTEDTGWIKLMSYKNGSRNITGVSLTSYTNVRDDRSNNGQGVASSVYTRDQAVASQSATGNWTISAIQPWIGATIATRPFLGGPSAAIAGTAALTLDGSADLAFHLENMLDFTYKAGQSITVWAVVDDALISMREATVQVLSDHRDTELIIRFEDLTPAASTHVVILVDDLSGDQIVTFADLIPLAQLFLSCGPHIV